MFSSDRYWFKAITILLKVTGVTVSFFLGEGGVVMYFFKAISIKFWKCMGLVLILCTWGLVNWSWLTTIFSLLKIIIFHYIDEKWKSLKHLKIIKKTFCNRNMRLNKNSQKKISKYMFMFSYLNIRNVLWICPVVLFIHDDPPGLR